MREFIFQKRNGITIWAEPWFFKTGGGNLISDPDLLFERADCEIIKDQRKIKVGRLRLELDGSTMAVYLKRYNAFSLRYRLASLFLRSGAVRSLRGAMILSRIGVSTGKPLAAIESRRWGMLERSFFLSEEVVCGKTADGFWREDLVSSGGAGEGFKRKRDFLESLARLFQQLHVQNVYHNDLKDANILVSSSAPGDWRFSLLDLEGIKCCWYLSRRRRVKNLVQLNRTLGRYVSRSQKLYLLRKYLGKYFADESRRKRLVRSIERASLRADRRSTLKTKLP